MRQPSLIRVPVHFLLRPINYNEHCSNCLTRAGKKSQKVVKLCENADRAFEQVRRARFVRCRPYGKQTVAPNVALLLIRARYYDPMTGEFTSRDPLEYVDGMSLYRGYFGINGVDPEGLGCENICDIEGDPRGNAKIEDIEVRIVSAVHHPATLAVAHQAGGLVGLGGPIKSLPDFMGKIAGIPIPNISNLYIEWIQVASGRHSGWAVWIRWPHDRCRQESCCLFWERLNWVMEETDPTDKDSWNRCSKGDFGANFPGVFADLESAAKSIDACIDEVMLK